MALHTAYVKELDFLPYLALTTTTGAVQLWQGDNVQWTREEGLSRLQVAEMAELPERKTIASHITGQDETFIGRAMRQLTDAKVRCVVRAQLGSNVQLMCRRRACPNMSSFSPRDL